MLKLSATSDEVLKNAIEKELGKWLLWRIPKDVCKDQKNGNPGQKSKGDASLMGTRSRWCRNQVKEKVTSMGISCKRTKLHLAY